MNDRTCFLCTHCTVSVSESDWSEVTPGDDWYLACEKSLFSHIKGCDELSGQKWHDTITKARDCGKFEERRD